MGIEFYTNANIKQAYKTYVKAVVSRFTNSPAILAWELANEVRFLIYSVFVDKN